MNPVRFCLLVLLAILVTASVAFAGGFQLNEVGARAMGMGGAFAAQANDLTALYFNPAGLAYQKGFGAYLGATMILPKSSNTVTATGVATDMVSQTFFPPNGYFGYGFDNGLAVAVGVFSPFGLGTEWPATWPGRYSAVKADLQAFMVNPTIAYKINEYLMVGAGVSWMYSKVKINYNIQTYTTLTVVGPYVIPSNIAANDGSVTLDANGNAFSFDVGAIAKPIPALSIGVSYRHSTKIDLSGDATFSNMQALVNYFPGGPGTATIKFPNQIFAGIAYDVMENLTLEFDYQWVRWSSYDSLIIGLPNGPVLNLPPPPLGPGPRIPQSTSRLGKAWNDTYLLRFGGEYRMKEWSFRLGFIYDATPQPNKTVEPLLPDANRVEGTVGAGYKFDRHWSVDVAYQFISFSDRTVTGTTTGDLNQFPGTYKNSANLIGLSVGFAM